MFWILSKTVSANQGQGLFRKGEKVYNSLMSKRQRYTHKTISPTAVTKLQRDFLNLAGPTMKLMWELSDSFPDVSLTVKNREGRIVFTNRFNAAISGWSSTRDMIGYTSEELYPPDQAAVYAGRDREVLESGRPIVERLYGFVADRSTDLNCVTIRPIVGLDGSCIGTATIYHRAQTKMKTFNWYEPIRKSVAYLNANYAENIPIERLARLSNYSVAQFRKLFTKLMHMSPSQYVTNVRVNAAKALLRTTDRRVTDIAAETGFCDHSHFIKTFRSATGQTPNEFRRLQ